MTSVADKIEKIKSQCQQEGFFYNATTLDPSLALARPPNVTAVQWENAIAKKPTTYTSVPVKWEGFQEVFNRVDMETQHVNACRTLMNQIEAKLDLLMNNHTLNTKLAKCQLKQRNLESKLLKISINLSVLKSKGYPLSPQEEQLVQAFNSLMEKLDNPMGLVRINELWAKLNKLKESSNDISSIITTTSNQAGDSRTSQSLNKLVNIIGKQQEGIQQLCEMVSKDQQLLKEKGL